MIGMIQKAPGPASFSNFPSRSTMAFSHCDATFSANRIYVPINVQTSTHVPNTASPNFPSPKIAPTVATSKKTPNNVPAIGGMCGSLFCDFFFSTDDFINFVSMTFSFYSSDSFASFHALSWSLTICLISLFENSSLNASPMYRCVNASSDSLRRRSVTFGGGISVM